jgi:hypothetical protein
MENKQKDDKSWAGIFDDFVSNPPTASVFRLYLLSFLIWNESAILYLTFHNQSMWDKLKNVYEFVPFHNEWSLYFGPFIPFMVIYIIVFLPVPFLKVEKEWKSFYDFLFFKHQTNLKRRLYAATDVLEAKSTQLEKQIEVVEKTEQLNETSERKGWLEEYEAFKLRTAIYSDFIKLSKIITTRKNAVFVERNNGWEGIGLNFQIQTPVLEILDHLGLILKDRQSYSNSNYYMSLTRKGKFFFEESQKLPF